MVDVRDTISKAILKSQHCQRNWDLNKDIPEEDLNLLYVAATQCPSKQNVAHYKVHFILNRDLINQIHDTTQGFNTSDGHYETNSQTLANLLVVLEENYDLPEVDIYRNEEVDQILKGQAEKQILNVDRSMAIGVAAGYLNLTATMLGYATGCCACFDQDRVQQILNLKYSPTLLMGIGHKDPNLNRRVHHLRHDFVFPTKKKQEISVNIIR